MSAAWLDDGVTVTDIELEDMLREQKMLFDAAATNKTTYQQTH